MLTYDNLEQFLASRNTQIQKVPISENGEPLVEISPSIPRFNPHCYQAAGAPYGNSSPFHVRKQVADKLLEIDRRLQARNLRLKIFDGYRPLVVQKYMVDWTFDVLKSNPTYSHRSEDEIFSEVFKIWAPPNPDPAQPPPHSTGGAVDLTLVNADGSPIEMGSEIDESGPVQMPNHFETVNPIIHSNRQLLRSVMLAEGFAALDHEWWHFAFGDRYWGLVESQRVGKEITAIYGRVE